MSRNPVIQAADPVLRRRTMLVFVIVFLMGAVMWLSGFDPEKRIAGWVVANAQAFIDQPALLAGIVALFVTPVGLAALTVVGFGRRVSANRRFPPPGARVIRDTPVLTGDAASRRGLVLQGLGAALFALTCLLPLVVLGIMMSLTR